MGPPVAAHGTHASAVPGSGRGRKRGIWRNTFIEAVRASPASYVGWLKPLARVDGLGSLGTLGAPSHQRQLGPRQAHALKSTASNRGQTERISR